MSFFQIIVLVLFGVMETHHDFSSEQLLHDPGQQQYQRLIFTKIKIMCYYSHHSAVWLLIRRV